jgi:TolB-like protein/thioredoxin-like negative regulator of GroEL
MASGGLMTRQMVCFDDFEVDLRSRELRKSGVRVRLQEQPFQILTMLLARPGDIVTRDEIRDRLWPDGTFVDFEHSVNAAIKRLRAALGDAAENPRFVETLHRRGYRFVARVGGPDLAGPVPAARPTASVTDPRPRLVVLPFTNLSGADTQDYFSDGLTEEMIMQLGRRCANRIGVLARTSSMLYKNVGRGAGDIGEALRADYLVEGSVRRDGDRVRITAQLIETKGETHIWADSFDRHLADCLAVQTEVAAEIAHALALELLPEPAAQWTGTRDPAAYQAFLRARFHWNKSGDEGLEAAIASYDETVALDPNFGKAYSGRARARISLCDYYRVEPRAALEAARIDARRALEIDQSDAEAHLALGEVQRTLDWNWDGAEAAYRKALAANPNNEAACRYYSVFLAARGRAEAPAMAERACVLDPLCLVVNTAAASVHYLRGDYEAAIHRHRHTLAMEPAFVPAHRGLAACLVQLGRHEEALEVFTTLPESRLDPVSKAWFGHALAAYGNKAAATAVANALLSPSECRFVPAYHLAVLYAGLEDLSAAFTQLNLACEARDPSLDTLTVEPRFRMLRGDPRYLAVLDRLRLARSALA